MFWSGQVPIIPSTKFGARANRVQSRQDARGVHGSDSNSLPTIKSKFSMRYLLLFSDGYADQFGEQMVKCLVEKIQGAAGRNLNKPMDEQGKIITKPTSVERAKTIG